MATRGWSLLCVLLLLLVTALPARGQEEEESGSGSGSGSGSEGGMRGMRRLPSGRRSEERDEGGRERGECRWVYSRVGFLGWG